MGSNPPARGEKQHANKIQDGRADITLPPQGELNHEGASSALHDANRLGQTILPISVIFCNGFT